MENLDTERMELGGQCPISKVQSPYDHARSPHMLNEPDAQKSFNRVPVAGNSGHHSPLCFAKEQQDQVK
jgi:hypothetical protein